MPPQASAFANAATGITCVAGRPPLTAHCSVDADGNASALSTIPAAADSILHQPSWWRHCLGLQSTGGQPASSSHPQAAAVAFSGGASLQRGRTNGEAIAARASAQQLSPETAANIRVYEALLCRKVEAFRSVKRWVLCHDPSDPLDRQLTMLEALEVRTSAASDA